MNKKISQSGNAFSNSNQMTCLQGDPTTAPFTHTHERIPRLMLSQLPCPLLPPSLSLCLFPFFSIFPPFISTRRRLCHATRLWPTRSRCATCPACSSSSPPPHHRSRPLASSLLSSLRRHFRISLGHLLPFLPFFFLFLFFHARLCSNDPTTRRVFSHGRSGGGHGSPPPDRSRAPSRSIATLLPFSPSIPRLPSMRSVPRPTVRLPPHFFFARAAPGARPSSRSEARSLRPRLSFA